MFPPAAEKIIKSNVVYEPATLSLGIVELNKDMVLQTFVKEANSTMYKAKKSGDNRIFG